MMGTDRRAELLAPAGSLESLKAAIQAGADAVYVGGKMFGARAYANNFDQEELLEAIDYAHVHGKKLYLTVNTLLKEEELEESLYDFLLPYYEAGLDAVIVQDYGVFELVHRYFKGLAIHASTQMMITGVESAKLLEKAGATRVVTARELSADEIKKIHDQTNLEIESFVHGALCYCYSGQCLFSSILGGRSGNRGRCAQPCRLPYDVIKKGKSINDKKEKYVLSPKDMCTIDILPEIIEAGVYSLKIEGRMKKPEYTAGVVSIYRKYLDLYLKNGKENYKVTKEDKQKLMDIFNRNGFNQGYYFTKNGASMITLKESSFRQRNEKLIQEIQTKYIKQEKKEKINGEFIICKDLPVTLKISCGDISVSVSGEKPQEAQKAPITKENIEKKLKKTGDTPFEFEKISIQIQEHLFIPVGMINQLRREALVNLKEKICSSYKRVQNQEKEKKSCIANKCLDKKSSYKFTILVRTMEQFETILENKIEQIEYLYLDSNFVFEKENYEKTIKILKGHPLQCKVLLALPHVFRDEAKKILRVKFQEVENIFDGYLVRNLEEFEFCTENSSREIVTDYSVYLFNNRSSHFLKEKNKKLSLQCLPIELNASEIRQEDCEQKELLVYGKIPLMVTAGCINKTLNSCTKKNQTFYLEDRYHVRFQVDCICKYCYNIIYNSKPISLLTCKKTIDSLAIEYLRMDFSSEKKEEVKELLDKFLNQYVKNKPMNEIKEFTRGHFKRGVE